MRRLAPFVTTVLLVHPSSMFRLRPLCRNKILTRTRRVQDRYQLPRHGISMSQRACLARKCSFSMSSSKETDGSQHTTFFVNKTVAEALRISHDMLETQGIDEPDLSVSNLLAACLDLPWESGHRDLQTILQIPTLSLSPLATQSLTMEQAETFHNLLQRRLHHEPIQYLLGQWDFYGHVFGIQPPLLCPRPETEQLVDLVLTSQPQDCSSSREPNKKRPLRILDIGAGTGCLGISLAAALGDSVHVHAIDVEPIAVAVSQSNAQRILGDDWPMRYSVSLVSADEYQLSDSDALFDVVVSNPPYIPRNDYENLHPTVKQYESPDALVSGDDGMDVIRTILQRLTVWARPGALCWMEVDPSQPELIEELCALDERIDFLEAVPDIFGRLRFVKVRVK